MTLYLAAAAALLGRSVALMGARGLALGPGAVGGRRVRT